ncbi:glycine betaine ABC transporter substrate-binding protein OsmF [Pistricoccus aurantiacus]|nr:ABC transporter substrate-binding protein [Pistricoccus aurantiacus]
MAAAVGLGAAQAEEKQQEKETDGQTKEPVIVSSKIDTEGAVLGELILQALKNGGVKVENRLQLGATNIMREAITAGEIDIYPEYTGNGAFFFDMTDSDVWKDADAAYEKVKELDREKNNIVWLTPAKANNTWAISVRGDLADEHDLKTLEDLSRYLEQGGDFKLAASAEFVESPVALPAFQKAYDFELDSDQLVVLSGGNTAATLRAAAQGTNGVNAAMAYGTDGGLKALDLRVLEDTKQVQPVYQPAPIVREEVLEVQPEIVTHLKPVFEALDLETLQQLNSEVAVNGVDPGKVAADFLASLDEKSDDPAEGKDSNKDE